MQLEPGQQIGRFTVTRRLGQGGMSNVYLARDPENDRDVVLKFPFEEMLGDVTAHERFTREVKIGKLLNHPNIQHLYELADIKGTPFLVLEYVPGEPLRFEMREKNGHHAKHDVTKSVDLGIQLGSALAYAHLHAVAHRDLKPENVIVTPEGQAKVMDFGIALLQGARRVTWGPLSTQAGTPDYMAPEQVQGMRGDARTDVYSLGMILYEYLAGRLPYQGDSPLAVMNQHVNAKAPPIHKFRHDIPPALEETIMKAIRRRPDDRWPTMEAFVEALRSWPNADVETLKAEREGEPDGAVSAKAGNFMRVPVSPVHFVMALAVVLFILIIAVSAHYLGHHHK